MPQDVVPTSPKGWPYIDPDLYFRAFPAYTLSLATGLDDLTGTTIPTINATATAASQAAAAAGQAAGAAGQTAADARQAIDALTQQITPRQYWGPGRPDVPANLDALGRDWVTAATSGAEFRSTNGPQGAWVWRKRGTAWVCVEGDTGPVDLTAYLAPAWEINPAVSYLLARRINNSFSLAGRVRVREGASIIGMSRTQQALLLQDLPTWMRGRVPDGTAYQTVGTGDVGDRRVSINQISSLDRVHVRAESATSGVWVSGDTLGFYGSLTTTFAWPLTL